MEEKNTNLANWREEISDTSLATLKIQDGEEVTFVFLDEGKKNIHPDYGESVMFTVEHNEEMKRFYVNPQNFNLLKQIKSLGELKGLPVKLSRKGSKKSDTRYNIEKVEINQT